MDYRHSHYGTLGVEKSASLDEIKRAFKVLALKHHPDKCSDQDAAKKFKEISEAYEVLSDEEKRRQYDQPQPHPQRQNFPSFRQHHGGFTFNFGFGPQHGDIHDIHNLHATFAAMFNRNRRADVMQVPISLKELRHGGTKTIEFEQPVTCSCFESKLACDICRGSRTLFKKRMYMLTLKPGVPEGHQEIAQGMGSLDAIGGQHGDLVFRIKYEFEPGISLDNAGNVTMRLPLTLDEILYGFKKVVSLSHIGGITISNNGYKNPKDVVIAKGMGWKPDSSLIIHFDVDYPVEWKPRQEESKETTTLSSD